ncbi:ABC-2 type transporter-domain-containing protein [Mucidula mucida]|nr:ABC-2 type transporter-domain-containing protein [Mucidula mucida]
MCLAIVLAAVVVANALPTRLKRDEDVDVTAPPSSSSTTTNFLSTVYHDEHGFFSRRGFPYSWPPAMDSHLGRRRLTSLSASCHGFQGPAFTSLSDQRGRRLVVTTLWTDAVRRLHPDSMMAPLSLADIGGVSVWTDEDRYETFAVRGYEVGMILDVETSAESKSRRLSSWTFSLGAEHCCALLAPRLRSILVALPGSCTVSVGYLSLQSLIVQKVEFLPSSSTLLDTTYNRRGRRPKLRFCETWTVPYGGSDPGFISGKKAPVTSTEKGPSHGTRRRCSRLRARPLLHRTAFDSIDAEAQEEVVQLARTVTNASLAHQGLSEGDNPLRAAQILALIPTRASLTTTCGSAISLVSENAISTDPGAPPRPTIKRRLAASCSIFLAFGSLVGNHGRRIDILRDFEGLVKAGEMLVVLGRPGSGCTTLLKSIAGETHGFYVEQDAHINYQGFPRRSYLQRRTDVHFPNLTVGQTLTFAARARTPRTRLPGVTRDMFADHMRDVVMAVFGLSHTVNTKVGNDFVRGVSGGERKRVSIAEAALSGSPLQCWDNSTRGLDSATALEFVKTIRMSTNYMSSAAVVAIYQASQDIYDIFDKAVLLYEGRQIYFGPVNEAKKFFTTADFLTSLTSPAERQIRPGFEAKVPRTPDEFAKAWKESEDRKRLLQQIDEFDREFPVGGDELAKFRASRKEDQAKGMRSKSPYTISTPMQVRLCLTRGFQRLRGDMTLFFTALFGNFVMALIISSVFYNLPADTSSFYSRSALLFFAILMNGFSSILEILSLYEQRPIVEKHTRMAFYHPFSEAIASMITDMPYKILNAIMFNLILYFMANLRREVDHFFIFLLFSFLTTLAMSMIFRTIGALSRTISQAMAPAALIILALVIYTGFTIPVDGMHPWFRWINYLDPIGYAFESLMVNEFDGLEFACSVFIPSGPTYDGRPLANRVCSTAGAEVGSSVVSGTRYLNLTYKYYRSHLWRNLGIIIAFIIFFCGCYMTATELITSAKSKGEVLVFRRGHLPKTSAKGDDEEARGDAHAALAADGGDAGSIKLQKQIDPLAFDSLMVAGLECSVLASSVLCPNKCILLLLHGGNGYDFVQECKRETSRLIAQARLAKGHFLAGRWYCQGALLRSLGFSAQIQTASAPLPRAGAGEYSVESRR